MPPRGKRSGAGRPPGSRNKRSVMQEEEIRKTGRTPLEHLVNIYQNEEMPEGLRLDAAKAAAPYVHARLSAVEMDIRNPSTKDIVEMTDEELEQIAARGIRRASKATAKSQKSAVVH